MNFFSQVLAQNPVLVSLYQFIKGLVILLDLALLGVTFFALFKLIHYRPGFVYDPRKWQKHVKNKKAKLDLASPVVAAAWAKVQSKVREGESDSMRLAVIEADGVVDEVLKRMGVQGATFAERLGRLKPERYFTLNDLWAAHRLRNNLVHTPDFQIGPDKAEQAVKAYEAFLKEVKALK